MIRTYYLGERDLPQVQLSQRDRDTFAQAAALLEQLRKWRDDADDDFTTDVALAGHVCAELARVEVIACP